MTQMRDKSITRLISRNLVSSHSGQINLQQCCTNAAWYQCAVFSDSFFPSTTATTTQIIRFNQNQRCSVFSFGKSFDKTKMHSMEILIKCYIFKQRRLRLKDSVWGKKKPAALMMMSVNILDSHSHIYPVQTGGQKDWPSPTWPRLSASICLSVIEQDTDSLPAPGCCSAAGFALWPRSVRDARPPCGINAGLYYLS